MRKFFIFIVLLLLCVTGCGSNKLKGYDEINYDEYVKLKESNASFPLVIGRTGCSACAMFKETMTSFIEKYDIDVKYIDVSKLTKEESNMLASEINFDSTPTTIFFKNGKQTSVYYRIVGAATASDVVNSYKRMGYIDGDSNE